MGDDHRPHWKSPVRITAPEGTILVIRGPEEALEVLPRIWPQGDDVHFSQAKRACLAALSRPRTLEEARYTFMGACRDARILVH